MKQSRDSITTQKIMHAAHSHERFLVREKIMEENNRGGMVARRLLWLLGKIDIGGIRQIVDIGSWHLKQSIEFANIFENAMIHAFEPVPESYKLCRSKLAQLNAQKKDRISIHNIALSNQGGKVPFFVVDDTVKQQVDAGFSSLLKFNGQLRNAFYNKEQVQKEIIVRADTLDNWCLTNKICGIDIMWIDVQGAELLVFQGAENILKNTKIIMTEVGLKPYYEGHTLKSEIDAFLSEKGFIELSDSFELNGFDFEANTIYMKT